MFIEQFHLNHDHRIALHRIALHCIALHRIASHCIASHRIASYPVALLKEIEQEGFSWSLISSIIILSSVKFFRESCFSCLTSLAMISLGS
jgi:hypothetical protein